VDEAAAGHACEQPELPAVWIDLRRARAEILQAKGQSAEAVRVLKSVLPEAARLSRLAPDDGREANLREVLLSALISDNPAEALVQDWYESLPRILGRIGGWRYST